ncbi:patatin-like phospholipase family protein [Cytophagales bacterium LB-30]|uniref:Patatin-like phospholipase family protein n=1 Tax=Shiella aurantiaca TaxID=3058365 RepID=A0ABT8F0R4_9BACT|nr:patatin-like phospholipase family protein [Shiella aurantiaca]MDN4164023.1 patatin-like phospholipase family protein [Shiella aurantiaca]
MHKQKVHLVLGSGGARGIAHIGVIEELEKNGFSIQSVSGSSMGALVGGIYCAGQLETYKNWLVNLDKIDVLRLVDFTLSSYGFVKGDRVFSAIEKLIGDHYIEDFRIPFTAVATDITLKKEVHYTSGSLFNALRASVAIPSVLTPVHSGKSSLVDGGVLNPLPLSVIKKQADEWVVAVNVNANIPPRMRSSKESKQEKEEKNEYLSKMYDLVSQVWNSKSKKESEEKMGLFELMNRSVDLLQDKLTELTLASYQPEIVVNISRDECSTFEFYRAKELIKIGKEALQHALEEMEAPKS